LDLVISANEQILSSYTTRNKRARECEENHDAKEDRGSFEPIQAAQMSGDFNFGQRSIQSFDRNAVYLINNHPSFNDMEASPLRASSFDLLFLLSMQESIHRVIASYSEAGEEKEVSFEWLRDFYNKGLEKYFDGNQSYGRADDFMDDLLNTLPALKTIGDKVGQWLTAWFVQLTCRI